MFRLLATCRRTLIAALAIPATVAIGIYTNSGHVAYATALISVALTAANAYEGSRKK